MRSRLMALACLAGLATPAAAQSALDGPLAPPGGPAAETAHHAKAKPKRAHHAAARPARPADAAPSSVPEAPSGPSAKAAPDDPLSLGMKWNGSNESAAQTRWQNLNGNAVGSGAEVGVKLHF